VVNAPEVICSIRSLDAGGTLTVTMGAAIWPEVATPAIPSVGDGQPIELVVGTVEDPGHGLGGVVGGLEDQHLAAVDEQVAVLARIVRPAWGRVEDRRARVRAANPAARALLVPRGMTDVPPFPLHSQVLLTFAATASAWHWGRAALL